MDRVLSKKEKMLLAKANLSPKAAQVVSDVWSKDKEPMTSGEVGKIIGSIIGILMVPTLIFILGANVFHWAAVPKGFENIAFFVIWIFFVIMLPIFPLGHYMVVDDKKPSSVFSYRSIDSLVGSNVVLKYYNRIALLALIGLIIFRGEIFTAVAMLITWIIALLFKAALKGKVRMAAQKLG